MIKKEAAKQAMTILICAIVVLCAGAALADGPGVSAKSFDKTVQRKLEAKYLLFLPRDYTEKSDKRWPLILFLHGAGERGDDVQRVKIHGPIKVAESQADFPFIVVAPQCPEGSWWDKKLETLTALLDDLQKNYKVDTSRVYLTGLSMGGFGTWALACEHPERFAAVAPICGGGPRFLACNMKSVPAWAFHGGKDNVVPLATGQEMVDALKVCGGDVKFTVYPDAQHDSWTATYNNPELYKWFLSHKREDSKTGTPK